MALERTILNILWNSLEISETGDIISKFYGLPDEGKGKLEIVAADLYRLDENLAKDWIKTISYEDFCDPKKGNLNEAVRIEERFETFLKDPNSLNPNKYNFKRILQFVVEGDNAVARMTKLSGDIREKTGKTVLGRFGDYEVTRDGKVKYIKFPIYAPSSTEQAEQQIELFWNKYKHLGGLNPNVLKVCPDYKQTVVLIKPHAFHAYEYDTRWGDMIDRFSAADGVIIGAKVFIFTREQLDEFYATKVNEPWYEPKFVPEMTTGKTLALLYEGPDIQQKIRKTLIEIIRPTFGDKYDPSKTAAHASDPSEKNAVEREKSAVNFKDNCLPLTLLYK